MTLRQVGLLRGVSVGHFPPDLESDASRNTVLVGGQAVATELDVVVDTGVVRQETLRMPRWLEVPHLPFSSSCRLV